MNEIEKLLAGLPRLSPSLELDARIAQFTCPTERGAPARANRRWLGALAACTACAGCIGFILGRESVMPSGTGAAGIHAGTAAPVQRVPAVWSPTERAMVNVNVPPTEALARFVMPPPR